MNIFSMTSPRISEEDESAVYTPNVMKKQDFRQGFFYAITELSENSPNGERVKPVE